jgi:hypothetical protein
MLPQLFRFDSTSYELPYSFRVVFLLLGLAMIMNWFRRWTNEVVKSKYDITPKKVLPKRPLRTSSLLMLLGMGSFMYWGLEGSRISGTFSPSAGWLFGSPSFFAIGRIGSSSNRSHCQVTYHSQYDWCPASG